MRSPLVPVLRGIRGGAAQAGNPTAVVVPSNPTESHYGEKP